MVNSLKCFVGLHNYEVMSEHDYTSIRGSQVGKVIVSKCKHCGKIKSIKVVTIDFTI